MTDILCRWLNDELRLSKTVEAATFAKAFSTGYLIGEILHKYQLQNDFSMFMKKDSSISKVNNFTRLEPTLQLLGISFDINTAQDLMQEKQGVATRLLYQLFVSLEKKKSADVSGTMMEIMQPAAKAALHKKGHEIYTDRLHQVVRRDADLKLQKISQHYEEKWQQNNDKSVVMPPQPNQQKRPLKGQDEKKMKNTEKVTIVQVPKPPPYTSQLNLKKRQQQRRVQQAQTVQSEIAQFETNRKKLAMCGFASPSSQPFSGDFPLGGGRYGSNVPGSGTKLMLQSNTKYIQDIRQRLEANAVAREQREKRCDRFLVEQFIAHEAQEEARRDEQLVKRLTRQTQQEQRLAAHLLQIRMQKAVIQKNRLFREKQLQERRERDFLEALEREAALAQWAKLERAEEIRQELEFCKTMAAERAQSRYKKHFSSCKDILEQIVDLATKVGEYRQVTGNLIPEKQMRGWKDLLLSGLPLYEPIKGQQPGYEFSTPLDPVELKKQERLNNLDYDEYTNMVGEWAWPEEAGETPLTLTNNNILGHVVVRMRNIVHPPVIEPSAPSLPRFTLKACVLGKFCSGKTNCLAKIAEAHGVHVISADTLIEEAVKAYQNKEAAEKQETEDNEQILTSSTSTDPDHEIPEESTENIIKMSTRAMQGEAADKEMRKGNAIPNELLVDIIVEAIRQVPGQSGWILDGFPADIAQAHLLEKALGGCVEEGDEVVSSKTNLVDDPNPPKPPPPPPPVLDLAVMLDIPDEHVVSRAFSQAGVSPAANADTDTAAVTSSDSTEKTLFLAQIPHRVTGFQETWPNLEKWFGGKQNILVRVDADVDEDELLKRVESVLEQVMIQTQEALATPSVEDVVLDSGKAPDSSSSGTPLPVEQPLTLTDEAPEPTQSFSSLNKEKSSSVKSLSESKTHSPRGHSRKASASSLTNEDSQVPKNSPESASPLPGSSSWVYVDEPLPPEIPELLCPYWDTVCDSYVNNVKTVMQQLRSQCIAITHHLYNIREEYKHYVGRPDLKQELVSQWQKYFSSIPDDMREEEETKVELHLRLDDLCERLWDISDKRKEDSEKERDTLMGCGRLEDHTAVLLNHYSKLMEVEFDRFKDTLWILRVYYMSMCKQVLPELPSNLSLCIPLLDGADIQLQNDRSPDSETKSQDQPEPVEPPQEKLISNYEEALTAITKSVSAEANQEESKEQKEKAQGKESAKTPASAKKKEKQSAKKQKGPPSPPPAPSPALTEDKNSEKTQDEEVKNKIHKEYTAALDHEANAAKVRIALVKGHGLAMIHSLQSRAEEALSYMEKCLKEHYLAEMKGIEQLSEVVHHHIEIGAKLQTELVLECTNFSLNGDCLLVASPPPPPRPPAVENPTESTPTITVLESLHRQLYTVAPSGLMSSSGFFSLLKDIISLNKGTNCLPAPWINTVTQETQLMEIVSLLTNDYKLVDWRRFLLSASLPWPYPSLTQLLAVLQRFKAADTDNTGYINEEQYLQTDLWFPSDSVLPVPEDPSEPLPYDRLANLRKFFFQLFADHSSSPPQLDYVSMLQYFAADPNPKQGFIRALSVVVGQHLKLSSAGHLVKSLPSIDEATELSSSGLDGDYKEEETPGASSSSLEEQEVSIPALLAVICHKITRMKDDIPLPAGYPSQEEHTETLVCLYRELGIHPEDSVTFSVLSQNPFIQHLMETTTHCKLVNIHRVLLGQKD